MAPIASIRMEALETLAQHPAIWRGADLARVAVPSLPSGFPVLDAELPGGGWPTGALTEILPAHEGIGELRLFGPALAALTASGKWLAWIAPPYCPYAPALAAAGIDSARMFIVRTKSERETLWAVEQALRSNSCGAVLAWLPETTSYAELRRLQLAAEAGESLAVLFRPPGTARQSSPAALRLALSTLDGGLAVRILKRRGAPLAGGIVLPAMPLATQRKRFSGHAMDRPSFSAAAAGNPAARVAFA